MNPSSSLNTTPAPVDTPDNVVALPDETKVTSFLDPRILEANMRLEAGDPTIVIQTPDYLEEQDPHPAPITEHVLQAGLARHRERLAQVAERALHLALQDDEDRRSDSDQESHTDTWELHPGWPYQERTNADDDIPTAKIKGPYVAITVDNHGEPRIITKKDCDAAAYDEGPLHAQPVELTPEEEEDHTLDPEGKEYIYGENTMLDCTFLAALGSLSDRGITAENLRLVQLEGEERALQRWEQELRAQESALTKQRVRYYDAKNKIQERRQEARSRLQKARAESRLAPLLPDYHHQPSILQAAGGRPYPAMRDAPKRIWGHYGCYWCGEKGIKAHQSRHCPTPHQRCRNLGFGRCVVPSYHTHYNPHQVAMDDSNYCPYHGDNKGEGTSFGHA